MVLWLGAESGKRNPVTIELDGGRTRGVKGGEVVHTVRGGEIEGLYMR